MVGTVIAVLALVASAAAQPTDHLACYKIKDAQAKAIYTATVGGLTVQAGCTIKVPAALLCAPASKTDVTPAPPGGGGTGTPNSFFCYKVKCPKASLPRVNGADQFGDRSVTPSATKLLCAPLGTPTTTSTTVASTTSTTIVCPSGEIDCSGVCTQTSTDPANCGRCGHQCLQGEACVPTSQGSVCNCLSPKTLCGITIGGNVLCNSVSPCTCSDLQTDSNSCGTCGNVCPAGSDCQDGRCVQTCCNFGDCGTQEFCCTHNDNAIGRCPYIGHCSPRLGDNAECGNSIQCLGNCCCMHYEALTNQVRANCRDDVTCVGSGGLCND